MSMVPRFLQTMTKVHNKTDHVTKIRNRTEHRISFRIRDGAFRVRDGPALGGLCPGETRRVDWWAIEISESSSRRRAWVVEVLIDGEVSEMDIDPFAHLLSFTRIDFVYISDEEGCYHLCGVGTIVKDEEGPSLRKRFGDAFEMKSLSKKRPAIDVFTQAHSKWRKYYQQCSRSSNNEDDLSEYPEPQDWNFIWHRQVAPEIKVFLWRLCQNDLPTGSNLAEMRSAERVSCPWCDDEHEDLHHAFLACPVARQVWAVSGFPWHIVSEWRGDGEDWVRHAVKLLPDDERDRFVVLVWSLWRGRNEKLAENKTTDPQDIVSGASRVFASGRASVMADVPAVHTFFDAQWHAPPAGTLKINVHGALLEAEDEKHSVGIGIVVRDHHGVCVDWLSLRNRGRCEPEMMETLAAKEAALLARDRNYTRVIIESSCLNLVNRLRALKSEFSCTGILIGEIRRTLRHVRDVAFCFVSRDVNRAAHLLARSAGKASYRNLELPDSVRSCLANDMRKNSNLDPSDQNRSKGKHIDI